MNKIRDCRYCRQQIKDDNFLECIVCRHSVHIHCLRRPGTPGDLFGDVFFDFTCSHCTTDGKEIFVRFQISWSMVIVLTLYNLSINSKGLSHHGFFHWQTHILYFINKNWDYIMDSKTMRRKKKMNGTISGALSRQSPQMFTSAVEEFGESGSGWWKLTHNKTPKWYMKLYQQLREEHLKNEDVDVCSDQTTSIENDAKKLKLNDNIEVFSRSLPYMGKKPYQKIKTDAEETTPAQADLTDFIESSLSSISMFKDFEMISPNRYEVDSMISLKNNDFDWPDDFFTVSPKKLQPLNNEYKPRIVQVTNFQEAFNNAVDHKTEIKREIDSEDEEEEDDDEDDEEEEVDWYSYYEKSLFTKSTKRRWPWEVEEEKEKQEDDLEKESDNYAADDDREIQLMAEYDEQILLTKLKTIINNSNHNKAIYIPPWIRRFYRKLTLREICRSLGKPVFDIDGFANDTANTRPHILDRFQHLISASTENKKSFYASLAGSANYEMFQSPNTGRILHPFIYRDTKCVPQWIQLMCELQYKVNNEMPQRASIDYCYLRPYHIAAVNGLLQKCFWHGIDMSECLSYPDFTVVALYKKLVVGCAFLVPDVGHNDAYVSFMAVRPGWQRAGIASFMMYHLTQTCMSRDITLHVSATNAAICLYQKFGFKIEGFILDFYEKYLPIDSKQSRHAFFLRMRR